MVCGLYMEEVLILSSGTIEFQILDAKQTLFTPEIKTARTLCGKLVNLSLSHQKYKSVIECTLSYLFFTPLFYPGETIKIQCIERIIEQVEAGEFILQRKYVPHSLYFCTHLEKNSSPLKTTYAPENGFISYLPLLNMMITNNQRFLDLQTNTQKTKITLEEI